ncbi:MAG: transposase, partial [Candidatus Saccharimonadales bacterium]
ILFMPVRNVVRVQLANTFYHVYNRGHNKDLLFLYEADYAFFEFLLLRCFGLEQSKNAEGMLLPWFGDRVQLNAFCLIPNHFHLLLYQAEDETAISSAMQSLATTYTVYFNKKHNRRGSAFESVFKSVLISSDSYLQHISCYIHLNPNNYKSWQHSSYSDYKNPASRSWIASEPILKMFDSRSQYLNFVDDYKSLRDEISNLKQNLADHAETCHNT